MLFNSKGKIFGKISIVDLIIIVLVIVAVVGGYIRFSNKEEVVPNDSAEIYYTMEINGIRESNMNYLTKSVGMEFFLNGDENYTMGVLQDVKVSDSVTNINLTDGTVVTATVPEEYDVILEFKLTGFEEDDGYYTSDMKEIDVGRMYNVCNLYCSVNGTVDKIWK